MTIPILTFLLAGMALQAQVKNIPECTFKRFSDGKDYSRKDIPPGKKTLILFFDTECPHCMQAMNAFDENSQRLSGINILLVTKSRKEEVMPFLKTFGERLSKLRNTTLLADSYNLFIGRFLPRKYPSIFLFSEKGTLMHYTDEEKDIPVILGKLKT